MEMRLTLLIIAIYCCMLANAKFGADNTVCNIGQFVKNAQVNRGPPKPTLPSQYSVRIEADIIDSNYTMDMHEYYDGLNNQGAVRLWEGGLEERLIFLYGTNELITLDYDTSGDPPRCHVDDLAKSTATRIFGLVTGRNGTEHIFTANQALRFGGNQTEVYIGRATARDGIIVDAWESCIYMDAQDTTMHMTWYFSAANGDWTTAEGVIAPIEADVYGITHVNSSYSYQVIRKYSFTDYRPGLTSRHRHEFQTPAGTYCPNRVSARAPPNVTNTFSFSAEIVEPMDNYVNWIREYYDFTLSLFRYDYTPDIGSGLGTNPLIRVHDFTTGLAYTVDPNAGNCTISAIQDFAMDVKSVDATTLRMRTAKEFFDMDHTNFQYAGQRDVRGIPCDVFAGIKNNYPSPNMTTLWEWYFASQDWMDNAGYTLMFYQPIMLQITSRDPNNPLNIIYNIYDYVEDNPNIWQTDISACFNYTNRKDYKLLFSGSYKSNVTADPNGFKAAIVQSVAMFAKVSSLRVNNVQVDYVGGNIVVGFTLLDSHPMPVNVQITKPVVTLAAAAAKLNSIINQGAFFVTLPNYVSLQASKTSPGVSS